MSESFMYLFYSLLLACAALLSLPWWVLQMLRLGKYRSGLAERLGFVPARLRDARPGPIWVHAVSVGEVLAVSQLISELQQKHPDQQIFVSTTTATGQSLARQRFGENRVFFMPLDFGFAVRRYLKALKPPERAEPPKPELQRALDGVEQRLLAGGVAIGPLQPALLRPAPVAVHHDCDVSGKPVRIDVHHCEGTYLRHRARERSAEHLHGNFNSHQQSAG
jgi:hypothetical protein